MGAFAFNLELEDGTPADPPTLKAAAPELEPRRHGPARAGQDAPRGRRPTGRERRR